MKGCVVETGTRIAPFLDPVGETPIGNRPLADWQDEAIRRAGLTRGPPSAAIEGPCVVFPDNLFVSPLLLRRFVAALREKAPTEPTRLRVVRSTMVEENKALQDLAALETDEQHRASADFPVLFVPEGQRWAPDLETADRLEVEPKEKVFAMEVPEHYFGRTRLAWPLTAECALLLRHWSHIVRVNMAALAVDALDAPWWKRTLWMLWAVLRAIVPTKARVMRRMSRIGRGCHIHPTATVEASVIEDGVTIGAHAIVSFSRIGKGTWIQEMSKVSMSVLGEHCLVSSGTTVNSCTLYRRAAASQPVMQLCVLGRKSITTACSVLMDMVFEGEQTVSFEGKMRAMGTRFLGSAVGHEAKIGSGLWLAPGRAIPNGVTIVRHPDEVIRSIPRDVAPGTTLVLRKGRLVPREEA